MRTRHTKKTSACRVFLFLLGTCISAHLFAQVPNVLSLPGSEPVSLNLKVFSVFHLETSPNVEAQQIIDLGAQQWTPALPTVENGQEVWRRVDISVADLEYEDWYLTFLSSLNYVELHVLEQGEIVESVELGSDFVFSHRPIKHVDFLVPLEFDANSSVTLLLKYKTRQDANSAIYLTEKEFFNELDRAAKYKLLLLYGALGIMVMYNFFIFTVVRDVAYLHYSLMMGCMFLAMFSMHGFAYQFFWPNNPWLHESMARFSMPLGLIFSALFCSSFLQLKRISKPVYYYVLAIAACCAYILVSSVNQTLPLSYRINFVAPSEFIFSFIILTYVSYIMIGLYVWRKGSNIGLFFTFAWFLTSLAMIAIAVAYFSQNQVTTDPFINLLQSLVVEALLLSFALGARIKNLQKMEVDEKNEFFSRVSHEMRTPLNGIVGSLSLFDSNSLNSSNKELFSNIKESVSQLSGIVINVLDFTKLKETSVRNNNNKELDLQSLVKTIYKEGEEHVTEKGLFFCVSLSPEIPRFIVADQERLNTAISMFIENSGKFTKSGYVVVYITCLEKTKSSCQIRFTVRDTGEGIKKEQLGRIFGAFNQAEKFYSRRHGGLGLGLSIAAKNIDALGSRIRVKSKLGRGTTFYFDLDVEYFENGFFSSDKSRELTPKERSLSIHGLNVLVVEDNPINQMVTKKILEASGCNVDLADDGREGVNKVLKNDYGIVLMDCSMPVMNGFEATLAIRDAGYDQLPIVAVTANAMPGDREQCLKFGMDDYVSKPIERSELIDTMKRAMAKYMDGSEVGVG